MTVALTHIISPNIAQCELSFIQRTPIDYDRAVQQHHAYCALLQDCGLEVIELAVNSTHPDSTFIEDTSVVVDEIAVMTRMGPESRRDEVAGIEPVLAGYRTIGHIQAPATLEGGDVLHMGKKVFVGTTPRTNTAGINSLASMLTPFGYQVISVAVQGCLHLKSACTAINEDTLLANPQWIHLAPFKDFRVVSVPEEEPWAANALAIDPYVCMHAGFTRTIELVQGLGFQIKTVDISELLKAEAGMTCSSIIISE
ncbi:MAG: dimethylarginine dimethylaminohydrolase family protein [Thermodesulfobacteriota bacterium]